MLVPRSHVCPSELTCHVDLCIAKCDTLTQFYSHLKVHIEEGRTVTCPFRQCNTSFTVLSTFTSYLCRKHKRPAVVNLAESIYARELVTEAETFQNIAPDMITDEYTDVIRNSEHLEYTPEDVPEALFLKNLALLYLKLQSKLMIQLRLFKLSLRVCSQFMMSTSHIYFSN